MWKFLHVACMFSAVSFTAGIGVFRNAMMHGADVATIRRALALERRLSDGIGGPLFVAGIAFGVVNALVSGFDLTAGWLVTAYILVGIMLVNGFAFYDPHAKRLRTAAGASSLDHPSVELRALLDSPRTWAFNVIDGVLWIAIVSVMVLKPFT
jgi:uncharacterized membrane protein